MNTTFSPYTSPEVERGLKHETIKPESLVSKSSTLPSFPELMDLKPGKNFGECFEILECSLSGRRIDRQPIGHNFIFSPMMDLGSTLSPSLKWETYTPNQVSRLSQAILNGDEIAEVLQSEAGFTIATDEKPILATYGCNPCVALGGYDATNKTAFVVHFSHAGEVRECGWMLLYNISKLAKEKIETPIQLHLRGGVKGRSEAIIKEIKIWMREREDLPMEIASQEVLLSGMDYGKSLSIDSRTGEVSEYEPMANPKARGLSDMKAMTRRALMSAHQPNITVAYTPK